MPKAVRPLLFEILPRKTQEWLVRKQSHSHEIVIRDLPSGSKRSLIWGSKEKIKYEFSSLLPRNLIQENFHFNMKFEGIKRYGISFLAQY